MSSVHEIRVKLERDYAIALSRYERAELATETIVGLAALEAADRRIIAERRVLKEKMGRLSYLLRLQVDPEWTDDHIQPLRVQMRERQGQIAKAAYRVLKAAQEPLKTREIARLVAPMLGAELTEREIVRIESAISGTLNRRFEEGMVERIDCKPIRWLARPRKWTRPTAPAVYASAPLVRAAVLSASEAQAVSASTRQIPHRDGA